MGLLLAAPTWLTCGVAAADTILLQPVLSWTPSFVVPMALMSRLTQSIHLPFSASGSFCVKSPNELNPTVSDFNETWHTCWLGTHSTKSKILGQSDQWCARYGAPNFESFGKNGRGWCRLPTVETLISQERVTQYS